MVCKNQSVLSHCIANVQTVRVVFVGGKTDGVITEVDVKIKMTPFVDVDGERYELRVMSPKIVVYVHCGDVDG